VGAQPVEMEFIPMTWGAWGKEGLNKALQSDVVPQIQSGKVKRLLGFNEPDKQEQANMPYTEALKYWPMLESLEIPLCSPACANPLSDEDESTQGVRGTWMRDFMREADKRNYRMDYIGVHWYGGPSPRSFKERMIKSMRLMIVALCSFLNLRWRTGGQNQLRGMHILKHLCLNS
jgi:hypothetical protein